MYSSLAGITSSDEKKGRGGKKDGGPLNFGQITHCVSPVDSRFVLLQKENSNNASEETVVFPEAALPSDEEGVVPPCSYP